MQALFCTFTHVQYLSWVLFAALCLEHRHYLSYALLGEKWVICVKLLLCTTTIVYLMQYFWMLIIYLVIWLWLHVSGLTLCSPFSPYCSTVYVKCFFNFMILDVDWWIKNEWMNEWIKEISSDDVMTLKSCTADRHSVASQEATSRTGPTDGAVSNQLPVADRQQSTTSAVQSALSYLTRHESCYCQGAW